MYTMFSGVNMLTAVAFTVDVKYLTQSTEHIYGEFYCFKVVFFLVVCR